MFRAWPPKRYCDRPLTQGCFEAYLFPILIFRVEVDVFQALGGGFKGEIYVESQIGALMLDGGLRGVESALAVRDTAAFGEIEHVGAGARVLDQNEDVAGRRVDHIARGTAVGDGIDENAG